MGSMRVGLWAIAIGVLASAGFPVVEQAHSKEKCSVATLKGTYLFAQSGYTLSNGAMVPKAVAGRRVFFGNGRVFNELTVSTNGTINETNPPAQDSYNVRPDCTGTLTINSATGEYKGEIHLKMYISRHGEEIVDIQTDSGTVFAGSQHRVAR